MENFPPIELIRKFYEKQGKNPPKSALRRFGGF